MVYAGIIAQVQLWRGGTLFQYLDIIMKAYSCYLGRSWLLYDEGLRMWAATNPDLSWDQVHSALWLQIMSGNHIATGKHSHSGHMVSWSFTLSSSQSVQSVQSLVQRGPATGRAAVTVIKVPWVGGEHMWLQHAPWKQQWRQCDRAQGAQGGKGPTP